MSTSASIPSFPSPGTDPPAPNATTTSPPPNPQQTPFPKPKPQLPPPPIQPTIKRQSTSASRSRLLHSPNPTSLSQSHATMPSQTSDQTAMRRTRVPFTTPFFTLVNDVGKENVAHPTRIHYIFSDDDGSEALTGALLRSTEPLAGGESPSVRGSRERLEGSANVKGSSTSSGSSATFRKDGQRKVSGDNGRRREERILIVDLNDNADTVVGVTSLSERWQVLEASVENAPTWDGEGGAAPMNGGLMLRIEGVGVDGLDKGEGLGIARGERDSGIIGEEEMQVLLEGFDKKMAVLRKVVGSGGVIESGEDEGRRKSGEGES